MGVPDWGLKELIFMFWPWHLFGSLAPRKAERLEKRICEQFEVKYCVTTDLGRQAITLALEGLGLERGDGVLVPSYVCRTAVLPIIQRGCVPQFVDIDPDLNLSPESLLKVLEPKSKAILVPHLYGKAARIEQILEVAREHGLAVIDDAAQATGVKKNGKYLGTFGDIGIFSFGPFKSIMATRGGALVTNSDGIYAKISDLLPLVGAREAPFTRALKSLIKFKLRRYSYFFVANRKHKVETQIVAAERLDFSEISPRGIAELDAVLILSQLKRLDGIVERRRFLAEQLSRALEGCDWLEGGVEEFSEDGFVKYVLVMKPAPVAMTHDDDSQANRLILHLRRMGIEAHGPYEPLHLTGLFAGKGNQSLSFTEQTWKRVICLPMNSNMSSSDIKVISSCLENFMPYKR